MPGGAIGDSFQHTGEGWLSGGKEYYVNDAGNQIEIFAIPGSRYLQLTAMMFLFPDNGYAVRM